MCHLIKKMHGILFFYTFFADGKLNRLLKLLPGFSSSSFLRSSFTSSSDRSPLCSSSSSSKLSQKNPIIQIISANLAQIFFLNLKLKINYLAPKEEKYHEKNIPIYNMKLILSFETAFTYLIRSNLS